MINWTAQPAAALAPYLHKYLQRALPQALWHGHTERREIALTFDDGPHPEDTPKLLDLLERHEVQATFFALGGQVERHASLIKHIAEAGHQLGIHGYHHRAFPLQTPAALRCQLASTQRLIAAATLCALPDVDNVRPPYGLLLPATMQRLLNWGYRPVMWSVVPFHWLQPADFTVQQVLHQATSGSLIVLHEGLSGPPVTTLAESIITRLKAADYCFVTVDQMRRALLSGGDSA